MPIDNNGNVASYLHEAGVFGGQLDKLMYDLTTYRDTLQANRVFFIEQLQSWRPEK